MVSRLEEVEEVEVWVLPMLGLKKELQSVRIRYEDNSIHYKAK